MDGPKFFGAHLLGDTTMLKFSLLHADFGPDFCGSTTSWGLCQSGKTANELLQEEWYEDRGSGRWGCAIIMVGTHDILRIVPDTSLRLANQKEMLMDTMKKIRNKAVTRYDWVLFCTVPEIPYLAEDKDLEIRARYIDILKSVNACIINFGYDHEMVRPVHMAGQFSDDCYERSCRSVYNPFIVHPGNINLNVRGLAVLRELISEELEAL